MVAPLVITAADKPVRASDVRLHRRSDDGVTLLERRGKYQQISEAAAAIWHWCDGEHGVDAIAQRYRERYGVDGSAAIAALLERWYEAGLVGARSLDAAAVRALRGSIGLVRSGASIYIVWSVEHWSGAVQSMAHRIFVPPMLALFAAIALAGGTLALRMGTQLAVGGVAQPVALAVAFIFAAVIHELGHAVTLARFGGTVHRAGIGWYWLAPIAFVDTSDAHTLPRAQRICVSLGGPLASFVLAAFATIVASCALPDCVRSFAWSFAIMNYGVSLWNLNPLIELDGYYILTDLLGRPNLRSDVLRALRRREPSRIELAYAAGVIAYACLFMAFVLPAIIPQITIAIEHLFV